MIPTRGDDSRRRDDVLDAASRQSLPLAGIVVVSTRALPGVPGGIDVVVAARAGTAYQRNVGLEHARTHCRADVVHFVDDDVVLASDYVELADRTLEDSSIAGVTARLHDSEDARVVPSWTARLLRRPQRSGSVSRGGRHGRITRDASDHDVEWLPGGLMSIRANVPLRFDETLETGPTGPYALHEDLDFSLRLGRFGRLVYLAGTSARHSGTSMARMREPAYWEMRARARRYLASKEGLPISRAGATYELAVDLGLVTMLAATGRGSWRSVPAFAHGATARPALPGSR